MSHRVASNQIQTWLFSGILQEPTYSLVSSNPFQFRRRMDFLFIIAYYCIINSFYSMHFEIHLLSRPPT